MADTRIAQTLTRAITQVPSDELNVTQAVVRVLEEPTTPLNMTQTVVRSIVSGRVDDPVVRAWTFTLDGHDYYVLRVGNEETLVYDVLTEQWYVWGSNTTRLWKGYNGHNWLAADGLGATYGSNVLVGDDASGALYFLGPDSTTDDDPVEGAATPRPFERRVMGQITHKGYSSKRVYDVTLEGSIGNISNEDLVSVELEFSDDRGNTYVSAGEITLTDEDYHARLDWRSLGSLTMPGRLFRITDNGALKRIDFMSASVEE